MARRYTARQWACFGDRARDQVDTTLSAAATFSAKIFGVMN
jgi:hypothetical protein